MDNPNPNDYQRRRPIDRLYQQCRRAAEQSINELPTPSRITETIAEQFDNRNKPPEVTQNTWRQRRLQAKNRQKRDHYEYTAMSTPQQQGKSYTANCP